MSAKHCKKVKLAPQIRTEIEHALDQGWEIEHSKHTNHWKLKGPKGEMIVFSERHTEPYEVQHLRKQLRKHGIR